MSYLLDDGRQLMASYQDIAEFFNKNHMIGKKIVDIQAQALDYMICNLSDIENIEKLDTKSSISTDHQICLRFDDGDHFEIEIPGDAPLILGYNTADFARYPVNHGTCYTLRTLFMHCLGRCVTEIVFEKSAHKMFFPAYRGIDMSKEDDGVKEIKLVLDDGSFLLATGNCDFFYFTHYAPDGNEKRVPFADLLTELSDEVKRDIFDFE